MQNGIDSWGSLPYLERMMQFSAARGQLLNDSIANIDTPGYVHKDVSPTEFQEAMRSAMAQSAQLLLSLYLIVVLKKFLQFIAKSQRKNVPLN